MSRLLLLLLAALAAAQDDTYIDVDDAGAVHIHASAVLFHTDAVADLTVEDIMMHKTRLDDLGDGTSDGSIKSAIDTAFAPVASAPADISDLQTRLGTAESTLSGLGDGTQGSIKDAIATAFAPVATAPADISDLQTRLGTAEGTLTSLGDGTTAGSIKDAISTATTAINNRLDPLDGVPDDIADLKQRLSAAEQKLQLVSGTVEDGIIAFLSPKDAPADLSVVHEGVQRLSGTVDAAWAGTGADITGYEITAEIVDPADPASKITMQVPSHVKTVTLPVADENLAAVARITVKSMLGATLRSPAATQDIHVGARLVVETFSDSSVIDPNPGMPLWSGQVYKFIDWPADFSKNAVYVQTPRARGDTGIKVKIDQEASLTICCANHCGSGNTVKDPNAQSADTWDQLPGTWAITDHSGEPCTFYTKVFVPGDYLVDCTSCWGSGVFVRPLDYIASPLNGASVVDGHNDMPLWLDDYGQYRFLTASAPTEPVDILKLPYVRISRNAGNCKGVDPAYGASFSLTGPATAYVCVANHVAAGPGKPFGEGWTALPGQYAIKTHAGTPCSWFSKVLQPGDQHVGCEVSWMSGVFLGRVMPTTP